MKLVEAEEKISSLSHELESIKSDLKSSSDKMSFEQKRFGTMNESLKEQLDKAMEKIDQVKNYSLRLVATRVFNVRLLHAVAFSKKILLVSSNQRNFFENANCTQ